MPVPSSSIVHDDIPWEAQLECSIELLSGGVIGVLVPDWSGEEVAIESKEYSLGVQFIFDPRLELAKPGVWFVANTRSLQGSLRS